MSPMNVRLAALLGDIRNPRIQAVAEMVIKLDALCDAAEDGRGAGETGMLIDPADVRTIIRRFARQLRTTLRPTQEPPAL